VAKFEAMNPQGLVPVLVDGDMVVSQSLAILEYLEEQYPAPPLLPRDIADRAYVRSLAQYVACDIHPLNIMRIKKFLTSEFEFTPVQKRTWMHHWMRIGLHALEATVRSSRRAGRFCCGDTPTIADVCLIPQWYNAIRQSLPLAPYVELARIYENCLADGAFAAAQPHLQPDVVEYDPQAEY
jgi:maleylpyruvate isomerase